MEKKIVYLKTVQIVLTLTIIWQLISLGQFCGTFANPKTFLCKSIGVCDYTLIGQDAETGEFGSMFNKLYKQFLVKRRTNRQTTEEPKYALFYFLVSKLPPAGRQCIPITISPFDWFSDWTGGMLDKNPLNNGTLFCFSAQLFFALVSLTALCRGVMIMRRSVKAYKVVVYLYAFASIFCWCLFAVFSINLELYWKAFWTCVNFQADQTNVPFVTLVLSIVMVWLSVYEIILHKFVRNDVDTKSANMSIHQKNGSAIV